jgi:hypothetical protein
MFNLPELTDLAQGRTLEFGDVVRVGDDLRILARIVH